MKILIVSALGETTAAALRLLLDGHDVRYYVHAEDSRDCGRNMVPLSRDWRSDVPWADLVWFDDVEQVVPGRRGRYGGGAWAQEVRRTGKPVVGGTPTTDKLENDRMFGQETLKQYGVDTVPMHRFTTFGAGIAFVKKVGGAWAIKHNAQVDRNLNSVAWKPDAVMGFLEWQQAHWDALAPRLPVDYVLQEAVKGVEMAVTGFFDGTRFSDQFYLNQEYKKLMDGDEGPATGQMGEMGQVQCLPDLAAKTLGRLTPLLAAEGYHGPIDLNCIATPSQTVPLEFTSRPGYPTMWSVLEALDTDLASALLWMAGAWKMEPRFTRDFICNVVIASGSWPVVDERGRNEGLMLRGVKEVGVKHVHLLDVQIDRDANIVSAGPIGLMASVTARGQEPGTARAMAYELTKHLKVTPYRIMRHDIGAGFCDDMARLASWGWVDFDGELKPKGDEEDSA